MVWNGRFQEWNGRQSSILPYQFHTRFYASYLQKNTSRYRMMINNIVTEVVNFNIYAYYLSTNRNTLVVYIAQTVYIRVGQNFLFKFHTMQEVYHKVLIQKMQRYRFCRLPLPCTFCSKF